MTQGCRQNLWIENNGQVALPRPIGGTLGPRRLVQIRQPIRARRLGSVGRRNSDKPALAARPLSTNVLAVSDFSRLYPSNRCGLEHGKGGFFSLADVRQLFANDWFLLAGWMHYLAFDLFIAAWVAAEAKRANLAPLALVVVLPLVFLFGPLGFLLFQVVRFTGQRRRTTNQ